MLVDFKVKNFRSIKEEQLLNMVASSQKEFIDTHTFLPTTSKNLSLVKTAAIYGANAADKSNILKSMKVQVVRYSDADLEAFAQTIGK